MCVVLCFLPCFNLFEHLTNLFFLTCGAGLLLSHHDQSQLDGSLSGADLSLLGGLSKHPESLRYSREFLMLLQDSGTGVVDACSSFPAEIIRHRSSVGSTHRGSKPTAVRKRGRRGAVRQRPKRQGHWRIPLPLIILANSQSLRNKTDILQVNVSFLSEYKNACLIALTETWLKQHDLQSNPELTGVGEPLWVDREPTVTKKTLGGGLCLYVNKNWCNTAMVREALCSPYIELLSVSLHPFYLLRKFPQIFITFVYIHLKANVENATQVIVETVHRRQCIAPDGPSLVMGDHSIIVNLRDHSQTFINMLHVLPGTWGAWIFVTVP